MPATRLSNEAHASIERRLITIRKAVGQLHSLAALDRARLDGDPAVGLVIERTLALLLDLAVAINSDVAAAVLDEAPQTPAASFEAARSAGLIDAGTAAVLAAPDGPHHVLVQIHLDSEPDEVAAVVRAATSAYGEYVRQVAGWVASWTDRRR